MCCPLHTLKYTLINAQVEYKVQRSKEIFEMIPRCNVEYDAMSDVYKQLISVRSLVTNFKRVEVEKLSVKCVRKALLLDFCSFSSF